VKVLALDIGGTWLRASAGGDPVQARTPATGDEALETLLGLADSVASDPIDAIGVSFGGRVVEGTLHSLHVPGWEEIPLADVLRERYGAPVAIANDANAGALGEWDIAGRPSEPVAYITVSTGVGGGIVAGGELLTGAHGLAGEVGHFVVDPDGEPCACGGRGCVETIASGPAIVRHGDYVAAAGALDVAVEALRAVVDPLFVAIGGGVAAAPQLWEAMRSNARRARSTPLHGARVLALLLLALALAGCGGHKTFTNPVLNVDFPDPFVLKVGGTYYAYATNGNGKQVQTATSKDLVHWKLGPDALPKVGPWGFPGSTWAPEVAVHGDTYVLYYTASSGTQCIGRAVAHTPLGPFVDTAKQPLVCQKAQGGSIDPDPSGGYLYWKNDGNSIGLTTHIWAQKLSPDGLRLVGPRRSIEQNDAVWEANVVEGPEMIRHDGRYYLFYSGGHFNEDNYAVGYATCAGPLGPCKDAPENPILQTRCRAHGPGHNTFADGWIVYHAWNPAHTKRVLWIDRLDWKDGKPVVHGPTCTKQTAP
jgi:predicted NBD/HSP70 family sugar kinase/GH43 family beta-xylosidase